MKLVIYEIEHEPGLGVISRDGRWIYPLASLDMGYRITQDLIENVSDSEKQLLEYVSGQDPYKIREAAPIGEVRLQTPISYSRQGVICLGINYMAHTEESVRYKKGESGGERSYVTYLSERVNKVAAPGEGIPSHKNIANGLDYEAELAVIIGERAANVPAEKVGDYIFGYMIINDASARTPQTQHEQWYFGKSLDGFLPVGPRISIADELAHPPHVQVQSRANGGLRQDSSTELLIFDIDHVVSEPSQGVTLQPETTIATDTPVKVDMGFNPSKLSRPGNVVECTTEGTGIAANQVVD